MSKRIVTLGTWDGKPIQWIVLKENKLGGCHQQRRPFRKAI